MSELLSFSRNELYAPLSSYLSSTDELNSSTPQGKNNGKTYFDVPSCLSESKLYDWLETVSKTYHGHRASGKLRKKQLDGKLMNRSLTLVGGGINNALPGASKCSKVGLRKDKKQSRKYTMSGKKRKKFATKQQTFKTKSLDKTQDTEKILQSLHESWNSYAKELISGCENIEESSSRLASAELGGSHVCISSCVHNPNLVGINGIILEETINTWTISQLKKTEASTSKKKTIVTGIPLIRIPKQGTVLTFRMIISKTFGFNKSSKNNENREILIVITPD